MTREMLLQWLRALDTRMLVWAALAGLLVQQGQVVAVRAQAAQLRADVDTLRANSEAHLVLVCLDTTQADNLRKARIPCAALFRRYGIRP